MADIKVRGRQETSHIAEDVAVLKGGRGEGETCGAGKLISMHAAHGQLDTHLLDTLAVRSGLKHAKDSLLGEDVQVDIHQVCAQGQAAALQSGHRHLHLPLSFSARGHEQHLVVLWVQACQQICYVRQGYNEAQWGIVTLKTLSM